jgi:predicted transcriptional regulator of viral defense system
MCNRSGKSGNRFGPAAVNARVSVDARLPAACPPAGACRWAGSAGPDGTCPAAGARSALDTRATVEAVVRRQHGLITREQAVAAGMPPGVVDHRVRLRQWRPVHPRVYLVDDRPADAEVTVRAAVLWAGEQAVLSGLAAAWWHGLVDEPPALVSVAVPRQRPRARSGIVVNLRELAGQDRTELRGVPVTALPLTVLDAAVEHGGAPGWLDAALRDRPGFAAVAAAHRRHLGRPGAAGAQRVLVAAAARSAQQARQRLVELLAGSGVAGWRCGGTVGGRPVDVAFPAARVAVEAIGWAGGSDRGRLPAAFDQGWSLLRIGWADLTSDPAAVLDRVASALSANHPEVISATRT